MATKTGFSLDRIKIIRSGVDVSRFAAVSRSDARASLGLHDNALVVGTVGRLAPVKDQVTLLEAMALLRQNGVPATLLVAGEGPLKESLQRRTVTLGLQDYVKFLGHRPDVERVLAAFDVFVLSSVSEGLSNAIIEAMASGLAVVATRVGGADEIVEDGVTGTLVPPRSPRAIALAIARLFRDEKLRTKMGIAARARAELEFTLPEMVRQYEALYQDLASSSRGGLNSSARPSNHHVRSREVV
jgi:glycosyltransferase involved in cell wall biosynthesis